MSPLRRLLRSVRALARPPWRLAALLGRPLRRFHPKLQRVVRIPGGPHPFSDEAIWHLSGQRAEFAVPPVAGTARGLCPALEVVTSYEDDLAELQRRLEALQVFTHRLAQLAPAPLTPSSHAAPAAPAAQRRREGLRMLQPGDKPEVGSILIAHPMSCIFQPDLDRAVIVIDEVHPGHVRGLVLNKPGGILMETLKPEELERAKEAGLSGLLHNRLYLGGDLMDAEDLVNHVRWLHSSDLPGAQRLAPGLHCGGEGLAQLGAARPVLGFAGWHQDQLDLELERGVWVHLRAHSAVGLLPNDGDNGEVQFNLYTDDLPGAKPMRRVGGLPYHLYGPPGNRPQSNSLQNADIEGAQADTRLRAPRRTPRAVPQVEVPAAQPVVA